MNISGGRVAAAIVFAAALAAGSAAFGVGDKKADNRENRQQKRIEQGIEHGQLTKDELAKLDAEETKIKSMQKDLSGDGPMTKDESKKLEDELNSASLLIWAERHNTDGKQMSEQRLGKDIVANPQITSEIDSGSITHAQARQFLTDERQLVRMKHRLSNDDLTDAQRTKLQSRYNDLLNKYFQSKDSDKPTT